MRLSAISVVSISCLFIVLFSASNIHALGIGARGDTHFQFEPGKKVDITVVVSNSLKSPLPITTFVEGEIAPYFTSHDNPNVTLGPRGIAQFTYTLTMPSKFDTPGEHTAFIYARQVPPKDVGGVAGIIQIGTKIFIHVPYPGKYVDAKLHVYNPNVNQKVIFKITAINRGSLNIENLYADIDIYDANDNLVDTVTTNSLRAVPNNEVSIEASWFANSKPGKYTAKATVYYDGDTAKTERVFYLGAPSIKITEIESDPIQNGSVGKIGLHLASEWNLRIDNVFAELVITKKGETVATLRSATINVEPWSKPQLNIFWDTTGINIGNYTGKVTLYYLEKTETKDVVLTIVPLSANISVYLPYLVIFGIVIALIIGVLIFSKRRDRSPYYMRSFNK